MKTCFRCRKKKGTLDIQLGRKPVCKSCFFNIIKNRVTRTVRQNHLIQDKDRIAVAISGGKDSRCLLEFMKYFAKGKKDVELIALHVFRGDRYATKGMLACEKICKEIGVKLHVASFEKELGVTFPDVVNITKKLKTNRCSVCGVMRRRILDVAARKLKCNKLATGHNLSDEAQSYLMNFIRGDLSTFSHLGPISLPHRKEFVQRIKPLRDVPEDDVKRYVDLKKWFYFPEPCPCRIGSLRFNVLEVMDLILKARPSAEFSIVRAGDVIRREIATQNIKTKLNKCKNCGELTSQETCKVCQLLKLK